MDSRQRERCDLMIIQPEWGTRNVNKYFYESEARRVTAPPDTLRHLALAAVTKWTCKHVRSATVGAEQTSPGRLAPSESAKAAFDGQNGCQKCFCVTFDESNKAYAPYPALITRTGRKDID